jgi:hypothetical protein
MELYNVILKRLQSTVSCKLLIYKWKHEGPECLVTWLNHSGLCWKGTLISMNPAKPTHTCCKTKNIFS